MKKILAFLFFITLALTATAQAPTSTSSKKTVKIGEKFFIETTTTNKVYTEITTDFLLQIERDDEEVKRDDEEIAQKQEEKAKRKAERTERNALLQDAVKKGLKIEPTTLEEKEKIKKIKTKIGIK